MSKRTLGTWRRQKQGFLNETAPVRVIILLLATFVSLDLVFNLPAGI